MRRRPILGEVTKNEFVAVTFSLKSTKGKDISRRQDNRTVPTNPDRVRAEFVRIVASNYLRQLLMSQELLDDLKRCNYTEIQVPCEDKLDICRDVLSTELAMEVDEDSKRKEFSTFRESLNPQELDILNKLNDALCSEI
jgi:hypothetical protein